MKEQKIKVGDCVQCISNDWRGEVTCITRYPNRPTEIDIALTIGVGITAKMSMFRKMTEEEKKKYY